MSPRMFTRRRTILHNLKWSPVRNRKLIHSDYIFKLFEYYWTTLRSGKLLLLQGKVMRTAVFTWDQFCFLFLNTKPSPRKTFLLKTSFVTVLSYTRQDILVLEVWKLPFLFLVAIFRLLLFHPPPKISNCFGENVSIN
jgi:hypothetical protein